MRLLTEGITDKGLRRNNNEDDLCVDARNGFFAVADGVGGAASGEVASRTSMKVAYRHIRNTGHSVKTSSAGLSATERLRSGIQLANKAIYEAAMGDPALQGMGTTIAAVLIDDSRLCVAHVGDSRVYLIRSGVITQLTEDHSLAAEQLRSGHSAGTHDEAMSHMKNYITRALGQEETVEVDSSVVALMVGDRIVLCTDGLTNMVPDDLILSTVLANDEPCRSCRMLIDLANKNGGRDNITVVLVYLLKDSFAHTISKLFRFTGR